MQVSLWPMGIKAMHCMSGPLNRVQYELPLGQSEPQIFIQQVSIISLETPAIIILYHGI